MACEQPAPPLQNYTTELRTCHKALISQRAISALKSLRDRYMSSSDMTEGSLTKRQITALPRIFHPRYHIGISQYSLIGNCGQSSSFLASCGGTTGCHGAGGHGSLGHNRALSPENMSGASPTQQKVFVWPQRAPQEPSGTCSEVSCG